MADDASEPGASQSTSPAPDFAAAVDLGSNSFHLIVGRLDGGKLSIVDRLREPVRLAMGLDRGGNIAADAVERALATLERFGQRVAGMPAARVRAVGTNSLRKANDSRRFLAQARQAFGYPIDVISGHEEARLIYLGVAQTMPEEGRRLVVDIGGGSTEVIIGEGGDMLELDSLYMGCVSFSERFFSGGVLSARAFTEARLAAELELQSITQAYRRRGWEIAVGCSGTVHAVQGIVRANGWSEDGITLKAVKKLRKALVAAGSIDGLALDGLTDDRKPVIAGGVAILEALFADLRVDRMRPSPGALREGVLYDLVGRIQQEDVRERTIRWLQERYHVDLEQALRVEDTAATLLGQAARFWQLDEPWAERQLRWSARLHEVGLAISHTGHHKHGAYLVRYSDLAGFGREEQRTVAALIRSQRRKIRRDNFAELDPERAAEVLRLSVLFRLAVRLNRGRDPERPPFVLKAKKERLRLHFPHGWLEEHPLTRAVLEEEARYLQAIDYRLTLHSLAERGDEVPPSGD